MGEYSQANRPMKVQTMLGEDVLLLQAFSGEEGVSTPFSYTLDLLSVEDSIAGDDVLRTPVTVAIRLSDDDERLIHGLCSRFVQLGQSKDLTSYRAEIVPWLWFLSLSTDCKIFQGMDVLDIVEQVFKDQEYSDFEIRCTKSYEKREYCVQYRETHLNFVSRLLEDEGIFYFFEHSSDKHVLVLADDNSAFKPCPGQSSARIIEPSGLLEEDVVTAFEHAASVHIGTVTLNDYDYLQPTLNLKSSVSGREKEEVYDYPGYYTVLEDGERLARLQLESHEALRRTVRVQSTCRAFQSGYVCELKEHYRRDLNQSYILLHIQHEARAGDYLSGETDAFDYTNDFLAIPHDVPFRPLQRTEKPVVQGSQTALVVGKAGEEIWTDKYGRIKVQFHWDRDAQKDENSSCWVRVSQPWAGKGWGSVAVPRIGQEVIVDFLEGNPDKPLIQGSLYNAGVMPPYELPGGAMVAGIKTNTTPGGGGSNEISMNDSKGEEGMTIHAQYDMNTTVENDHSLTVHNNRSTTVDVDDSLTVTGNRTITVDGTHTENIAQDTEINVTGGKQSNTVANEIEIKSDSSSIHLTAATEIQLEVGGSKLLLKSDGSIEINGVAIAINGSAKVAIHGGQVSSEADTTHNTKGALVLSYGSGTNTVKGGMVMLNP